MGVVREDVIKVTYDVQQNPFGDVNNEVRQMTSGVESATRSTKGLGSAISGAKSFVKNFAQGFRDGFQEARAQVDTTKESVGGMKSGLSGVGDLLKNLSTAKLSEVKQKLSTIAHAGMQEVLAGLKDMKDKLGHLPRAALDGLVQGFKKVGSAAVDAAGKLTKFVGKTAVKGIAVASAAVIGLGAASIGVGANFESSMSQVAATMGMTADEANYNNEEYAMLANTAKEMGATTKFSASQSAEALNYMALAGYSADQACTALPTVLNLAAAGGMELAAASDMVTDSMSALGIEATNQNLQTFGDQLAKTAQKSNTSVAQLGEAVLTVGGTAKSLSGGTTELNALLGIIADNGVKGAEGGTALRNIMLSLQAPTDTAAKAMKKLGLDVYDAQGQMRPMNQILGDLNSSMATMTDQQKQDAISTIFNKNDLKSVNALLANCGDRYDELSGYIENSKDAMANMADTMNDNLTGRITEFKSAAEGAGIAIYEALGSSNLKDIVKDATGWITELTKATESGGISGLAKAAGNVLSEALTEISSMMPDVIDTGVDIIDNLLDGINSNSSQISNSAVKAGMSFLNGIFRIVPKLVLTGLNLISNLVSGIAQNFPAILASGQQAIGNLLSGMQQVIPSLLASVGSIISQAVSAISAAAPTMIPAGISTILNFIQGAVSMLPTVLSMGIQLISSIAQGIVGALPVIAQQGPQIIHDLISSVIGALPQLAQAMFEGIIGILQNLPDLIIGAIKGIGGGIIDGVKSWFTDDGGSTEAAAAQTGANTANSLADGITANSGAVSSAMQDLSATASTSFTFDASTLQASTATLGTDFTASLAGQQGTFDTAMITAATDAGTAFSTGLTNQTPLMVTSATGATKEVKGVFDAVDLNASGVNAGQGFANGLASQKGTIMAVANDIGSSVSATINKSLDIHSPSRVLEKSGVNSDLGLIKGITKMKPKVEEAATDVSNVVRGAAERGSAEPVRGSVSNSTVTTDRSRNETNNFSPSFTLNMNGASATAANEQKVRKWIRKGINDTFTQLEKKAGYSIG